MCTQKSPRVASVRLTHYVSVRASPTVGLLDKPRQGIHASVQGHTTRGLSPTRASCWRPRSRGPQATSHGARTHAAPMQHPRGTHCWALSAQPARCGALVLVPPLPMPSISLTAGPRTSRALRVVDLPRENRTSEGLSPYANNHLQRPAS